MQRPHIVLFWTFLMIPFFQFAQEKIIDHTAYNDWKRIGEISISNDGNYSVYSVNPYKGDGFLYVVNNITGKKDSIARGKNPQFTYDGSILVFKIAPKQEALRKAELDKQKKEKWPKDSLAVLFLKNDSLVKFPNLKEVKIAEKSNVIAYTINNNNPFPKAETKQKDLKNYLSYYPQLTSRKSEAKSAVYAYLNGSLKKYGTYESDGNLLTILNFDKNTSAKFINVSEFSVSESGTQIGFLEQRTVTTMATKKAKSKTGSDSLRLFVYNSVDKKTWLDKTSYREFSDLNFSTDGKTLIGLANVDTLANRNWSLLSYETANGTKKIIIDSTQFFEETKTLTDHFSPYFVNNNEDIFFGVWDEEDIPVKDTILENEKVKLDIWHWQDERIQPEQLYQIKRGDNRSNLYVYHLKSNSFVELADDSLDVRIENQDRQIRLLASCEKPYRAKNWESPNANDLYVIDVQTGEKQLLKRNNYFDASISPGGSYFSSFDDATQQYTVRDLNSKKEVCATCNTKENYMSDLNGMPMMNGPIGTIAWTKNENGLLIQAEHDIVYFDIHSAKATSIVESLKQNAADTNYNYTISNLLRDSLTFSPENLVLTQFNEKTKESKVFALSGTFPNVAYQLIDGSNHNFFGFKRGLNASTMIYQKQSNIDYPDLYKTAKPGAEIAKISNTNPQQKDYNWSTVELIEWKSYSGIPLEGLLYKPQNFDPNKSYPLLVYYYELYSDEIHNHYAPKPTASIIFPTEYASAGYLVLIPDIRYKPGYPARGAYDCIMSGTDAVLKKYPNVDSTRMGLQGQSWGGYQTAQLITMTNRYKAAMAGAPVSNMFSAYGGIRWGSGFSRQFQYEHTQSRIGKTIWEAPELYVENSPLFHLPNVKTPLLIMANDQDGAVPWYQGIELYMGLRRLSKPVWMLNYNGDDHNLMKPANRMDLSIRMRQFFDCYLLNQPAPNWLANGIPAADKGVGIQYDIKK